MTSQVNGPGMAGLQPFLAAEDAGKSGVPRGEWNGLSVTIADDPASLLADAMEEMSFGASEKVEKDISDRKKKKTGHDHDAGIRHVEALEEVEEKLRKNMAEQLAKLLAAVRASGGNPARFLEALADFTDPTERHVALAWLETELENVPSLRALATRERERLEAEEAQAVQAGYNIADVDAAAAGGEAEGRAAYRRTILGHGGVGPMLEDILARHGSDDFSGTVEFLRQAVAADLSAAIPSTDKRELEALNNDLYHLRALANFTREFGDGITKLRAEGGKALLEKAGLETMRLLCKAKEERLVMLDGLKTILKLEGSRDPVYDVRALTQTQQLAHKLPAKLFSDEDARQRLLAAGQKLLDAAIDLEEAALAEGG